MRCKELLEVYLRERHVLFEIEQHTRAFSAQRIAETEHIPGSTVAKTVIVFADNALASLVLPASQRADLTKVREALGAHEIRLAHEAEFAAAFPGCDVGAMPPFGNLYGIPVYVEQHLTTQKTITFPVGTYTETMSLAYADFERLVHPTVLAFAQTASFA